MKYYCREVTPQGMSNGLRTWMSEITYLDHLSFWILSMNLYSE
jgi:hypothetical protein